MARILPYVLDGALTLDGSIVVASCAEMAARATSAAAEEWGIRVDQGSRLAKAARRQPNDK
ncbi:hypothetical protein WMF28_31630 [Sorangium sp. So ce590]|uniref:hypothetical protein n=1 Tax=Sorangium sp. So ce590 TaxID=3133317 RepID=UPI003F63E43B